jgi:hypothetical protein
MIPNGGSVNGGSVNGGSMTVEDSFGEDNFDGCEERYLGSTKDVNKRSIVGYENIAELINNTGNNESLESRVPDESQSH